MNAEPMQQAPRMLRETEPRTRRKMMAYLLVIPQGDAQVFRKMCDIHGWKDQLLDIEVKG